MFHLNIVEFKHDDIEFKIFNSLYLYNESIEAIYSIDETNNNILIGSSTTDYKFALVF